jgi:hypothetical protein
METTVSHAFALGIHEGIFFCVPAPKGYVDVDDRQTYDVVNGRDGLISYYRKSYQDLKKDVYEPIEQLVGKPSVKLRITDLEQKAIDVKKSATKWEQERRDAIPQVIYSQIKGEHHSNSSPHLFQFDMYASTNVWKKIFVGSDIYMIYDTPSFGTHPISDKKIVISLGNLNPKIYNLTTTDVSPGVFKISISSVVDTNNLSLFDTIMQAPNDSLILFHGSAQVSDGKIRMKLFLSIKKAQPAGRYFDIEKRQVGKFKQIINRVNSDFPINK